MSNIHILYLILKEKYVLIIIKIIINILKLFSSRNGAVKLKLFGYQGLS